MHCRLDPIAVQTDLPCLNSSNCWYCKKYCLCCSLFILDTESGSEFCSDKCRATFKLDPSATPAEAFGPAELADIFKSNKMYGSLKYLQLLAFTRKIISTELDKNTLLRIYLGRSDESISMLPPGTLFAICQIKTTSTQVVIDCVLSEDFVPLEPIWYSDYCERMIEKYRPLLYPEIEQLMTQTCL